MLYFSGTNMKLLETYCIKLHRPNLAFLLPNYDGVYKFNKVRGIYTIGLSKATYLKWIHKGVRIRYEITKNI